LPHTGYESGGAYGYCDRCAQVVRHRMMRREWSGLLVCVPCHDPRPPYLDAPHVYPEGLPVMNARPEPTDTELSDNQATRDAL
jgi:hypothetical protein